MTIWNLTEFSEIDNSVLTPYENLQSKTQSIGKRTSKIKRMIVMMAAATTFTVTDVKATPGTFSAPIASMAFAQSGIEQKPPLDTLFKDRFDKDWSKEEEDALLLKLAGNRKDLDNAELLSQAIDSIFLNQQEDISDSANRLSRTEIEKIVKQRKLV